MTPHTPLDDFEFKPAAEIRKDAPPPRRKREQSEQPSGAVRWHIWSALSLFFLAFLGTALFHLSEQRRLNLEIDSLHQQRDAALHRVEQLETEIDSIDAQLQDLNRQFNNSRQGKEKLLQTIEDLQNGLGERQRKIEKLQKEQDTLENRLQQTRKTLANREETIDQQETRIAQLNRDYAELNERMEPLMDQLDKMKRQLDTVQGDLSREGEASRRIISELLEKDRTIGQLETQLLEMTKDRDNWKQTAARRKRVEEGDLVPIDEHVTTAKPLVHPPVLVERKGLLFGKVEGFVMINAQIDEVGRVRNARYLEHRLQGDVQPDAIINRAMQTVMQWKFAPAEYDESVNVQVWQAVLVPVKNQ